MKYTKFIIEYLTIVMLFANCSASTETRYDDEPNKRKNTETGELLNEDFDLTSYKTDIEIESFIFSSNSLLDAWYDYDDFSNESTHPEKRKITGTRDGYRLLIIATDDLEEANTLRAKLYKELRRHNVYISFEPPFYKVKLGDFTNLAETNDLKFKLNQLGFREARIVQETVNLYEE